MSDTTTPHTEDTTGDPTWDAIEKVQNTLANYLRRHDAGKSIDASSVIEQAIETLRRSAQSGAAPDVSQDEYAVQDLLDGYWDHVAKRKQTMPTGLAGLNNALGGGLEPGRLLVLLGAPGGGKTTLANQIGEHAASSGRPVFYVTSEDSPYTLIAKTLSRIGKIKYTAVLKGHEDEHERIDEERRSYAESSSSYLLRYLDASRGIDVEAIKQRAKRHFEQYKEHGQGLLIVDYLQRLARGQAAFTTGRLELRNAVTVLTEKLRAAASELDCTVLALASQNRASVYGSNSTALATAKESGDIEYTADVVMAVCDDEERTPSASWLRSKVLRIDKNRQGGIGTLALDWYPECQQFTEAKREMEQPTANGASNSSNRRGGRR